MAVYHNRSREIAERLIKLRDYLQVNATPTHAVKAKDMLAYLADKGYDIEIKTLYSDLETLKLFLGVEVKYDRHLKGYILTKPEFEPYELRLIVNSIQAAQFITQEEADRLTSKIMKLADKYTRPSLKRQTYIPNRVRTINEEAMKGLDTIYEAIAQNRKISYKYFRYTLNGLHKSKEYYNIDDRKTFMASPYYISWTGDKFIIYALRKDTDDMLAEQYAEDIEDDDEDTEIAEVMKNTESYIHCYLELNHMAEIKILTDKREGNDIAQRQLEHEDFENTGEKTKLKVPKEFVSDIVDKFGNEARISPVDNKFFIATINQPCSPELYMWARTSLHFFEIIYPENAENRLKSYFADLSKSDVFMVPYFMY